VGVDSLGIHTPGANLESSGFENIRWLLVRCKVGCSLIFELRCRRLFLGRRDSMRAATLDGTAMRWKVGKICPNQKRGDRKLGMNQRWRIRGDRHGNVPTMAAKWRRLGSSSSLFRGNAKRHIFATRRAPPPPQFPHCQAWPHPASVSTPWRYHTCTLKSGWWGAHQPHQPHIPLTWCSDMAICSDN